MLLRMIVNSFRISLRRVFFKEVKGGLGQTVEISGLMIAAKHRRERSLRYTPPQES